MRVLKAQPGIREIGRVTDPLGRKGVALAVEFPAEIRGSSEKMPYGRDLRDTHLEAITSSGGDRPSDHVEG
jgi:hypothetical protein